MNIPLPDSGRRWRDIVLHDGVPNGQRDADGRVFSVFDELELWETSQIPTLRADVHGAKPSDFESLVDTFWDGGWAAEDWSASVRMLCKACSEGLPHDHGEERVDPGRQRLFGFAAPLETAQGLLNQWARWHRGRSFEHLEVVF